MQVNAAVGDQRKMRDRVAHKEQHFSRPHAAMGGLRPNKQAGVISIMCRRPLAFALLPSQAHHGVSSGFTTNLIMFVAQRRSPRSSRF